MLIFEVVSLCALSIFWDDIITLLKSVSPAPRFLRDEQGKISISSLWIKIHIFHLVPHSGLPWFLLSLRPLRYKVFWEYTIFLYTWTERGTWVFHYSWHRFFTCLQPYSSLSPTAVTSRLFQDSAGLMASFLFGLSLFWNLDFSF